MEIIEYSLKVNGTWKIKVLKFVVWLLSLKESTKEDSDLTVCINIEIK